MPTRISCRLAAAMLALLLFPSCDSFEDVVVPAADDDPPIALAAVWQDDYLAFSDSDDPPLYYEVELDDLYVLIGAGLDTGGMKKIKITHDYRTFCKKGALGETKSGYFTSITRTQAGNVGSTVSDGLWDGPAVRLSDYDYCTPGYTLGSVTYSWSVTAEDFHGNETSHGPARIWAKP